MHLRLPSFFLYFLSFSPFIPSFHLGLLAFFPYFFLCFQEILIVKLVSTKMYLTCMSLYPMVIHREEKSVEEKFCLDAEVRGEAERFKKKLQKKAADVSF